MKNKKILSLVLVVLLTLPAGAAYAAMPTPTVGSAYDGVDFGALSTPGNHIYYGAYSHASGLYYGYYDSGSPLGVAYEPEKRPVLWRVMGEEAAEGKMTLLSEYVLDGYYFYHDYLDSNANKYSSSDIINWLNDASYAGNTGDYPGDPANDGFLSAAKSSFLPVELGQIADTAATTSTYDYNDGGYTQNPTTTTGKFYLPWGIYGYYSAPNGNRVGWSANDVSSSADSGGIDLNYTLGNTLGDNKAYLRGDSSTEVSYWLRSPDSYSPSLALCVRGGGRVFTGSVRSGVGVRPAFKLNPQSVIFISEIVNSLPNSSQTLADTNYAAGSGVKNYKLTVVSADIAAGTVTAGGQTVDGTTHPTAEAAPGSSVSVAATGATAGTKLTYKIVDSSRAIVGYGQGAGNTSLAVAAEDPAGSNLAADNYTVYVWAQKDNEINSHEGSAPLYFTMRVTGAAPAKNSGGGGCDAGFGALGALAALLAVSMRRFYKKNS